MTEHDNKMISEVMTRIMAIDLCLMRMSYPNQDMHAFLRSALYFNDSRGEVDSNLREFELSTLFGVVLEYVKKGCPDGEDRKLLIDFLPTIERLFYQNCENWDIVTSPGINSVFVVVGEKEFGSPQWSSKIPLIHISPQMASFWFKSLSIYLRTLKDEVFKYDAIFKAFGQITGARRKPSSIKLPSSIILSDIRKSHGALR